MVIALVVLGGTLGGSVATCAVAQSENPAAALAAKAIGPERGANIPSNFKRHTNTYWTWYGPRSWIDSYGANDLYVSDPVGDAMLHRGFSAAPCYTNSNQTQLAPEKWFRALRANFNPSAFFQKRMRDGRYTKVGRVRHLPNGDYGPYGYRQTDTFKGTTRSGNAVRGEMVLDYFYDQGSASCGEGFFIRSALKSKFSDEIKTLRKISKLVFYG